MWKITSTINILLVVGFTDVGSTFSVLDYKEVLRLKMVVNVCIQCCQLKKTAAKKPKKSIHFQ